MININKYNTLTDYLGSDNIVSDECRVSQIGRSANMNMLYTPPSIITSNRVLTASQLQKDEVAIVVKDKLDGKIKYIPEAYFNPETIDQSLYEVKPWVRYRGEGRNQLMVYKTDVGNLKYTINNYYKVLVDNSTGGTITITATINGTEITATYTYSAGDTLDGIVTGLNDSFSSLKMTYENGQIGLHIGHVSGEDFIRVAVGTYNSNSITVSGGTVVDLTTSAKYRGTSISSNHRPWSGKVLTNLFANDTTVLNDIRKAYGIPSGNLHTALCYCRHGENLTRVTCLNKYRCKIVTNKSGSTDVADAFSSGYTGIKESTFNSWTEGIDEFGTWDNYMAARMMNTDSDSGVNSINRNNSSGLAEILANVTTEYFDGTFVQAFPLQSACNAMVDQDLCPNGAGVPTAHQLGCIMCDEKPNRYSVINSAIAKLDGKQISSNARYFTSNEYYNGYYMWYYSTNGVLGSLQKYYTNATSLPCIVYSY